MPLQYDSKLASADAALTQEQRAARSQAATIPIPPAETPAATPSPTVAPTFVGYTKVENNPTVYGQTANGQNVAFENEQQFTQSGGDFSKVQKIATAPAAFVPFSQYQTTQARTAAADNANAEAKKIFDSLKTSDVETRKSADILAGIKTNLETPPVKQPSLVDTYKTQSDALGINDLNTKLQNFDQEIKSIDTQLLTEGDKAGDLTISQSKINSKRSDLQKEADIRKAYISLERNAVATQLNGKIATLNTIMDLTGKDYSNATEYYNQSLDRSVKLYELMSGAETKQQNEQDKVKTQATANLTAIQNLITEKGLKYDSLTPDQQTQIRVLELQAGLPAGTTAAISTAAGNGKVLTTTTRQEANGNAYYDSLIQAPDGSMKVVSIFKGKEKLPANSNTEKTITIKDATNQINTQWKAGYIQGNGKISSTDYRKAKQWWIGEGLNASTFDTQFNDLIDKSSDNWKEDYGYSSN